LDRTLASQAERADLAFVALYGSGDADDGVPRGVVRYFDVHEAPPRRGRPHIATTLTLKDMARVIGAAYEGESRDLEWAEPEPE